MKFNPPPNWPPAPAGWTPPDGWKPDPSWPEPPYGWQLWLPDDAPVGYPPAGPATVTGQAPIRAKGRNGVASFDGRTVTLTRTALRGGPSIGRGEKRIPIRSITGVQFKKASVIGNGFIQFTVPGGIEQRSSRRGQAHGAFRDENSVVFDVLHQAEFAALRDRVEAALS